MRRRRSRKKIWLIAVSVALILAVAVGGTIAYLKHTTNSVQNTFAAGKLLEDSKNFVLKEHEALDEDKDGVYTLNQNKEVTTNAYTVLPGVDLPKDPFVRTDETLKLDAYVFIEVVDGTGTALTCTVDSDNWTELSDVTGPNKGKVYVMKANNGIAEADAKLGPITILKDNKITVANEAITDATKQFGGDVTFYGYMIQAAGFTNYTEAWTALDKEL